jgi:hypothetical protein
MFESDDCRSSLISDAGVRLSPRDVVSSHCRSMQQPRLGKPERGFFFCKLVYNLGAMAINPETWKLVGGIISRAWAALGPLVSGLVGVLVGAFITGRRQRRDWLANSKKEEYRELLSALSKGYHSNLLLRTSVRDAEEHGQLIEDTAYVTEVIQSRIFIADKIGKLKVSLHWGILVSALEKTRDTAAFRNGIATMTREIQETALKDMMSNKLD